MAKEQGSLAKSQQPQKARKIVITKGDYHRFKFAGTDMKIRANAGEVFTVHDDKNRPQIRRVDRTISSEFAEALIKSNQAEWEK